MVKLTLLKTTSHQKAKNSQASTVLNYLLANRTLNVQYSQRSKSYESRGLKLQLYECPVQVEVRKCILSNRKGRVTFTDGITYPAVTGHHKTLQVGQFAWAIARCGNTLFVVHDLNELISTAQAA